MENLKLIFLNPKPLKLPLATVYKTGRLTFNASAKELMAIDEDTYIRVATDGEPDNFKYIFLQPHKEGSDGKSTKVTRFGGVLSIKFANILELLGVDTKKFKVIMDRYDNKPIFKLKPFSSQ